MMVFWMRLKLVHFLMQTVLCKSTGFRLPEEGLDRTKSLPSYHVKNSVLPSDSQTWPFWSSGLRAQISFLMHLTSLGHGHLHSHRSQLYTIVSVYLSAVLHALLHLSVCANGPAINSPRARQKFWPWGQAGDEKVCHLTFLKSPHSNDCPSQVSIIKENLKNSK